MGKIILPVIMCGGSGTRLWPASRGSMPKQFIRLAETNRSSFQAAACRAGASPLFERPLVISGSDTRFIVAEQLLEVGLQADIILEPQRRDSAAAVAAAACYAAERSPDTVVLVMAADHVVTDTEAFVTACRDAASAAQAGYIVTLGIRPSRPAVAYGYIKPGVALADCNGVYRVERFVEKPDADAAGRYIEEGYLWNGGYLLFRADVMLEELLAFSPAVLEAARGALAGATRDLDFIRLEEKCFLAAPKTSIDYAVIERSSRLGVVPVSFPWSDLGTWDALWDVLSHDNQGNATHGRVELLDTRNSLVHSVGEGLTAVVGLSDVVVVSTPDAVLVVARGATEKVKDLVAILRAAKQPEADEHRRMYRPWGWYQRIDIGSRFQVKRIMVKPGGRLSLQKHFHRAEHWVVVHGTAEVTVSGAVSIVHENEGIYLPIGSEHRLTNPGRIPLELIEVQVGSYTGEDDIVRLEDVYGRSS